VSAPDTALAQIVTKIERELASFYDFEVASPAAEHLVSKDELVRSLGSKAAQQPEWGARGAVWVVDPARAERDDDVFIGVHIASEVAGALAASDPTARLADANLDAYCVVIEEVSHFHLILNRALAERGVSRLELEYQGEIDKMLVCALTLERQSGDAHLLPLARRLFDAATIVADDHELYWEATRHAARFWYQALRDGAKLDEGLRETLRAAYRRSWADKVAA
jgi:hypothetical protein